MLTTCLNRRIRIPVSLAAILAVLMFGFIYAVNISDIDSVGASTRLTTLEEFEVLEETYDLIRSQYVLSSEVTDEQLMHGAAEGMIDSLGDEGHSTFLNPEEAEEFNQSIQGEFIGIGIHVDTTGPQPVVISPIDGSPAYNAGIRSGDVIIAVDGVGFTEEEPAELVERIRGEVGTKVDLTLRHQHKTETYAVTIVRQRISIEPVSWVMLPNGVLWLRISQFSSGATQDVIEALRWGKEQGMASVILDLRNNPGGLVTEADGVGSQFLPANSVLYQEQLANGSIELVRTTGTTGEWQHGPIVVLVNEGSASASEIVSSAIRDNDRGLLIGQTTFGTGTVLNQFEMSDGSVALLGTKLWLTADGHDIWKQGIDPTIEVVFEEEQYPAVPFQFEKSELTQKELQSTDDSQLLKAHEHISAVAT